MLFFHFIRLLSSLGCLRVPALPHSLPARSPGPCPHTQWQPLSSVAAALALCHLLVAMLVGINFFSVKILFIYF